MKWMLIIIKRMMQCDMMILRADNKTGGVRGRVFMCDGQLRPS